MILGITGTIGAGKGAAVEYLKGKGFIHLAARDFIEEEVKHRGLPINRDSMVLVANDLRAQHGPAYIVEALLKRAQESMDKDVVIESIRTIAEAELLKRKGAFLLAIDADQRIRYERVIARASETDHVDFDTFVVQEGREMQNDDPNKQNIAAVMEMADVTIESNDGLETLYAGVDAILAQFKK